MRTKKVKVKPVKAVKKIAPKRSLFEEFIDWVTPLQGEPSRGYNAGEARKRGVSLQEMTARVVGGILNMKKEDYVYAKKDSDKKED